MVSVAVLLRILHTRVIMWSPHASPELGFGANRLPLICCDGLVTTHLCSAICDECPSAIVAVAAIVDVSGGGSSQTTTAPSQRHLAIDERLADWAEGGYREKRTTLSDMQRRRACAMQRRVFAVQYLVLPNGGALHAARAADRHEKSHTRVRAGSRVLSRNRIECVRLLLLLLRRVLLWHMPCRDSEEDANARSSRRSSKTARSSRDRSQCMLRVRCCS